MPEEDCGFDTSAESAYLQDGSPAIALKIQGPRYELNVLLSIAELPLLREVLSTRWDSGALRIGSSAGAAAFWAWSCEAGEVWVGVGHDDETWDFGVLFPKSDFLALIAEIERELGRAF